MNNNLKDKFLYFCNAENDEDYFSKTLIYLCENNSEGSFGIIINRTVEIRLKDFFSSASEDIEAKLNKEKIVIGGPVEPMTVYIIHTKDDRFEELISINDSLSISTDFNLIKSILDDNGPKEFLVSFEETNFLLFIRFLCCSNKSVETVFVNVSFIYIEDSTSIL